MVSSAGIHPLEITLAEYLASRQSEPVRVIDVREQDEWDAGHMAEATLLPLGELEERRHELDRESPLVIVCRSGRRSWSPPTICIGWDSPKPEVWLAA